MIKFGSAKRWTMVAATIMAGGGLGACTTDSSTHDPNVDAVVSQLQGELNAWSEKNPSERQLRNVKPVLACVEKAADFLRGGLVAYQDEIKRQLLGVTADSVLTIDAAKEMAVGALGLFDADVAVSTTGVAGDKSEDGTPPGTVYIATAVGDRVSATEHRFTGTPEEVCDQARHRALLELIAAMR